MAKPPSRKITRRTPETRAALLALIAEGSPRTLAAKAIGLDYGTLTRWMNAEPDMAVAVEEAEREGSDFIAQQCLDIAEGKERMAAFDGDLNHAQQLERVRKLALLGDPVNRDKLRIETRLKLLSKRDKRYADKQVVEADVKVEHSDADARQLVGGVLNALRNARRNGVTIDMSPVPALEGPKTPSNGVEFI